MFVITSRRYWIWLGAILGVALAVRIGTTARFQGLSSPPNLSANPDAGEYEVIAYHVSSGQGYGFHPGVPTAARPPGAPLTFAVPYVLFGRSFLALHLWVIALSAGTALLLAWLGALCGGRRLGLIAAAWLAVYPGHFYYAMHFLSEPVFGFWLTLACALCIRALGQRTAIADGAAGVAWGLAILTRVEMILAVPIAWALIVFAGRSVRRRVLPHAAVQTAVALLLISVWVGRNVSVMGVASLSTQRGYAFWGAHNPVTMNDPQYIGSWVGVFESERDTHPLKGSEVARDGQAWNYGVATVRANLARIPYLTLMKIWRFFSPSFETPNKAALWVLALGWIVTAPFVAYGLWAVYRHPRVDLVRWMVLAVPMIATLAMAAIFYGSPRFRDALAPLFLVVAAYGVTPGARDWAGGETPLG